MKIIRPYAKILYAANLLYALNGIEFAARVSHRSEEIQSDSEATKKFIEAVVMKHGDWSVTEHVSASVEMVVDRGITHELVRHRLFGFTQESTRFVNYEKKLPPSFIYPKPEIECFRCLNGEDSSLWRDPQGHWWHGEEDCHNDDEWMSAIYEAEKQYKNLLSKGWRPQEARSVFPNALAAKIIITGNLRNWRHFFLMRTTKEAHPQMRQVTIPLLKEFQERVPLLYDDIIPEARQIDNLQKGR